MKEKEFEFETSGQSFEINGKEYPRKKYLHYDYNFHRKTIISEIFHEEILLIQKNMDSEPIFKGETNQPTFRNKWSVSLKPVCYMRSDLKEGESILEKFKYKCKGIDIPETHKKEITLLLQKKYDRKIIW